MELINTEVTIEEAFNDYSSEYSEPISLEIIEKIPIYISFNGYEILDNASNMVKTYKNYIISTDCSNNILYNIHYDFIKNSMSINGKFTDVDEFIYIPSENTKYSNQVKTHDYCIFNNDTLSINWFNENPKLQLLMDGSGFSHSDVPLHCKYMFIDALDVEKLTFVEMSNIMQQRILLIALINPEDLNSLNGRMKYLSNPIFNQLFFILLVKNASWEDFVLDKIFRTNMYSQRKEEMENALTKMENDLNYLEYFIHKKNKLCPIL
jgi:hypothetical protein